MLVTTAPRESTVNPAGIDYRPDIDGIRALAVASVVLYHGFPKLLPGGFVGVDMFFVISGYLISQIVVHSTQSGSWSYLVFYARRVRRLFPALILVLLTVVSVGFFCLYPDELAELRRETLASSLFVSNFDFMTRSSYFDIDAISKPLLHLWSLGVEEQFYFAWPLILILSIKTRSTRLVCLAIGVLSLGYCVSILKVAPRISFYSPLSRAWEFSLGALMLLGTAPIPGSPPSRWCNAAARFFPAEVRSVTGFFLVGASLLLLDDLHPFPGWRAFPPAIGAALIIIGTESRVNRLILAARPAVYLGLISYPLYLWHWPILYFARLRFGSDLSSTQVLGCLCGSLALAALTHRILEVPIRSKLALRRSAVWVFLIAMLLVGMELLWTQTSDADLATEGDVSGVNLTWIHSDAGCVNLVGLAAESAEFKDALFCSMSPGTGPISTALIGDSMANALFPGLRDVYAERGERIINIGNGTCAPFRGMDGALPYNRECASINEKIYAFLLARKDIKTVIWAFAPWDAATMRIRGVRVSTPLKQRFLAIAQLEEADFKTLSTAGKRVVVTYDTPFLGIRPLDCLHGSSSCETTEQAVAARMEPTRSAWTELFLSQPGPCIFSQDSLFRLPGGRYRLLGDDGPLFRDDHHLSLAGSALVARSFTKSLCLD